MPEIILASTSPYRRELLARLRLPFTTAKPHVDETRLPGEAPAALASRLALAKAQAVAAQHPAAIVIGSDQVAHIGDEIFSKPGTAERARAQLRQMSGQTVLFQTALALIRQQDGIVLQESEPTEVRFRTLTDAEITRYVEMEQPLDCAGSAKAEALGISLLDALASDDPTAIIGLPLIRLTRMLRTLGVALP
ncbi:MAG: septum formation inhibitor Maf [Rhodocyclaceae bacterium]|nr:septum formation inhibitor Maf [Rhodocyclaceae bacterium]